MTIVELAEALDGMHLSSSSDSSSDGGGSNSSGSHYDPRKDPVLTSISHLLPGGKPQPIQPRHGSPAPPPGKQRRASYSNLLALLPKDAPVAKQVKPKVGATTKQGGNDKTATGDNDDNSGAWRPGRLQRVQTKQTIESILLRHAVGVHMLRMPRWRIEAALQAPDLRTEAKRRLEGEHTPVRFGFGCA